MLIGEVTGTFWATIGGAASCTGKAPIGTLCGE